MDITIETEIEFGSIVVVALDNNPIKSSRNLLVQIMTQDQSYGFNYTTSNGVNTITNVGGPPILVYPLSGTITFTTHPNQMNLQTIPLDLNGYPLANVSNPLGPTLSIQSNGIYYNVIDTTPVPSPSGRSSAHIQTPFIYLLITLLLLLSLI